MHVHEHK